MLSVRYNGRALPLYWCAKTTHGNIGYEEQKLLLDEVALWIPENTAVVLLADRFYGTTSLLEYCGKKNWDYRLRFLTPISLRKIYF
jgi:hypothetical protein